MSRVVGVLAAAGLVVACGESASTSDPSGTQRQPAETPSAAKPAEAWVPREKDFLAAGLTEDQAAELVAGLRELKEGILPESDPLRRAAPQNALLNDIVLDAAPRLADGIKRGAITVKWEPLAQPRKDFEGLGFRRDTTNGEAKYFIWFSARGRKGTLTLRLPEALCSAVLWDRMEDAERGR